MVRPFARDSFALIAYIELVNADAPCDTSCDFFFSFFEHAFNRMRHPQQVCKGRNVELELHHRISRTTECDVPRICTNPQPCSFFFLPLLCNLIFSRCTAYTALRIVDNLPKITAPVIFFPQIIFSQWFLSMFQCFVIFFFFFLNKNDLGHEFKKVSIC